MSKLNNKLGTIPSKKTRHKRDTNFPFAILPKERKTLQFSNPAIDKYLPTFGDAKDLRIAFKVPLKSHLKGLKLRMLFGTKNKYFVLYYWFQNRYHSLTLGRYRPGFGVKEAKTEHDAHFVETEISTQIDRSITNTLMATRYDYLRIAKAMMDDWQNDTCEGKYLKSLYERKVKKNRDYRDKQEAYSITKSYGGFFHLDPSGMKNRHIFIMDGYGGQTLTIDFDRKRIVTTMAVHRDFNWMKIAHSAIKKGK